MMFTIVYTPAIYSWDRRFWPPSLDEMTYYEWQAKLWKLFTKHPKIQFIWKVVDRRTNNLIDPISFAKSRNIRYSDKSLNGELAGCDLLLCDYPSTPMFDAWKKGIKAICFMVKDTQFLRGCYQLIWSSSFVVEESNILQRVEWFLDGIEYSGTYCDMFMKMMIPKFSYPKRENLLAAIETEF